MTKTVKSTSKDKSSSPVVSCILIFLNGENYIEEAIESVIAQTFTDWELILVDDGTTDGATKIARRYSETYPGKIIVTEHENHENRGMSASRNAGLRMARGKYIAFLDADDIWLPKRLETHLNILIKNPGVTMSMGPTLMWSSWNTANLSKWRPWLAADMETELGLPINIPLEPPIVAIGFLENHGGGVPGICSLLIKRKDLEKVGGSENSFRTLYEDQVLYFKVALHFRVIVVGEVLDYYRQHPDSACHQAGHMKGDIQVRPVFLEWLQGYLIDNGFKSQRLWNAYRQEMFRFDHPGLWRVINLPIGIIDRWNVLSRKFVIWVLTPKVYNALRRKFRLSVSDVENVR